MFDVLCAASCPKGGGKSKMNRTVRKVAERLRKRNEFDDLLQIYEQDKGVVTLPARLAVNALAGFEHAGTVTAELNVQHTRRVAAAQATQAPKGPPPGMPGDAARVLYPQPHQGGSWRRRRTATWTARSPNGAARPA